MAENKRYARPQILRKDLEGGDEGVATVRVEGREVLLLFPGKEAAEEFMKKAPACAGMETAEPSSLEEIWRICAEHSIVRVGLYGFFGTEVDVISVEDPSQVFEEVPQ